MARVVSLALVLLGAAVACGGDDAVGAADRPDACSAGCFDAAAPARPADASDADASEPASQAVTDTGYKLVYHDVLVDRSGRIVPWFSTDVGEAYDHVLGLVWSYWNNETIHCTGTPSPDCPTSNGLPRYMEAATFEVRPQLSTDSHGLALESWKLYYAYTGNPDVLANMRYIADFTLAYGLSASSATWGDLMYQTNTNRAPAVGPGFYDGATTLGAGYLLPHSSANFAKELVDLYKMTGSRAYLDAAVKAADTLAKNVIDGDATHSPYPLSVRAADGAPYPGLPDRLNVTAQLGPVLDLFTRLIDLRADNAAAYEAARTKCIAWLKKYPMNPSYGTDPVTGRPSTSRFGYYFEDDFGDFSIATKVGCIDTTPDDLARWILENPSVWNSADPATDALSLLQYTGSAAGCANADFWDGQDWRSMGVSPISEESWEYAGAPGEAFPGQSDTAHHYSVQLMYDEATGVATDDLAIRSLTWATYMVDTDGKNRYPNDYVWVTDGYGDYVQHYLRAMGAFPGLAPASADHLLRSSSIVKSVTYAPGAIRYVTYDDVATEVLRVTFTPSSVAAGGSPLPRLSSVAELRTRPGYTFGAVGDAAGVLRVRHEASGAIEIAR